ncbi:hypothetical protein Tco_1285484 [Tanacetum coccineum]
MDADPLPWMLADLYVTPAKAEARGFSFTMFEEMDLFAFICHSDPTKVRIGEREPAEMEVKLLTSERGKLRDASGSTFPPKKLRRITTPQLPISGEISCHYPWLDPGRFDVYSERDSPTAMFSRNDYAEYQLRYCRCFPGVPPLKVRVKSKNLEILGDSASAGEVNADAAEEVEAVEAIHLRGQLSIVEAADAAKDKELRDLKERNFSLKGEKDALSKKVTTLESVAALKETELVSLTAQVTQLTSELSSFQLSRDKLSSKLLLSWRGIACYSSSSLKTAFELFKGRMEAMQDEQATALGNRVAELDAQLLEMAAHLDEEFYPRFLTAISGRGEIKEKCLSLLDAMVLSYGEPFVVKEFNYKLDSATPAMSEPITTLSTNFTSSDVVPPLQSSMTILDMKPHD